MSDTNSKCSHCERCITCSDQALFVTVQSVDEVTGLALVGAGDITEEVDITLLDGASIVLGDTLLVHGGVAIAHLCGEDNHGR